MFISKMVTQTKPLSATLKQLNSTQLMPRTTAIGTAYMCTFSPNPNALTSCSAAGLIKQQKLSQALADCQQAVQLNPDYARAHGRMGLVFVISLCCSMLQTLSILLRFRFVYSSQGRYAEAKKCFSEVYTFGNSFAWLLCHISDFISGH